MFELVKSDVSLPFAKFWWKAFAVSAVAVVLSILVVGYQMLVTKNFNWGTDFAGGTEAQLRFAQAPDLGKIAQVLSDAGFVNPSVTFFGEDTRDILLRFGETSESGTPVSTQITDTLTKAFGADAVTLERLDEVGPKVGRDLKVNAIISLLIAMLGIFAYVWFRFTPEFAPGAVIALVHDVVVSLGVFALFRLEFELSTLAALLTIVGYSVNDTVVIYDRIRDRLKEAKWGNYIDVVVQSLNETLSRTILTSLLTFLVVVALFIYTRGELRNFAFILMVGIIAGSYSTLFVASPILVWMEKRKKRS